MLEESILGSFVLKQVTQITCWQARGPNWFTTASVDLLHSCGDLEFLSNFQPKGKEIQEQWQFEFWLESKHSHLPHYTCFQIFFIQSVALLTDTSWTKLWSQSELWRLCRNRNIVKIKTAVPVGIILRIQNCKLGFKSFF